MSNEKDLVSVPYDKHWDAPVTRREFKHFVDGSNRNDIFLNKELKEAFDRIDTNFIVTNMIAEKLGITRDEMTAYAERQKAKIAEIMAREQKPGKEPEQADYIGGGFGER